MIWKISLLVLLGVFLITKGSAQILIQGKVLSTESIEIDHASISIINKNDSLNILYSRTNDKGSYYFNKIKSGLYIFRVKALGFVDYVSNVIVISDDLSELTLEPIILKKSNISLREVQIYTKQKIQNKNGGNSVIRLDEDISSAGSSVVDVLEKSPGVSLNRGNGVFAINGREGATIMINGKQSYLSGDAVVQMLNGLAAGSIEKIEILGNPSSSYDAEGNAGIINIVLKRATEKGATGTLYGNVGFGKGSLAGTGGSLNYSNKKFQAYIQYSFTRLNQDQLSFNYRENESNNNVIETNSFRFPLHIMHNLKSGFDLGISENSAIGGQISFFNNKWSMRAINETSVSSRNKEDSSISVTNNEVNLWKHFGGSFFFNHKFRDNSKLMLGYDYLQYDNSNPANYEIRTYKGTTLPTNETSTYSSKNTPIRVNLINIDYTSPLYNKFKFISGLKYTFSRFNNSVNVGSDKIADNPNSSGLNSDSKLRESIYAGYADFTYYHNRTLSITGGLRYEHTLFDLEDKIRFEKLLRNYGNLFSTLSAKINLGNNNNISMYYSNRISRPSFTDIAAFVIYLDPFTLFTGNLKVQPSKINTFGIDYQMKDITWTLSYSYENNSIGKFQIVVDPINNIQVIQPLNLKSTKLLNLGVMFPAKLYEWWKIQNNFYVVGQNIMSGPSLNDENLRQISYRINISQIFTLPHQMAMDLSAYYNSKFLSGALRTQSVKSVNLGIRKKFSSSEFSVGILNVFNSQKVTSLVHTSGYFIRNGYDHTPRTFKISYTYKFGKSTVNANLEKVRSEEIRKRVE